MCNVAIERGADWRSLPKELAIDRSGRKERAPGQQRDVRYSRIDGSGHFRTATTSVAPNAQGSTVVHPTVRHSSLFSFSLWCKRLEKLISGVKQQKRVLSVRECARAQGFPDSWKFLSVSERPSTVVRDVRHAVNFTCYAGLILLCRSNSGKSGMRSPYPSRALWETRWVTR